MEESLISIIIPIYKVEKYLNNCLDSIINQTYRNLEIILVDDGSPDNCPNICDEYAKKDSRIVVIHKENGGLSSARNAGLDVCTGDYISFIDSDDFVSKGFIKVLYDSLTINKADISECEFSDFVDSEQDTIDNTDLNNKDNSIDSKVYSSREMQLNLLNDAYVNHVVVWNKLYKKSLFENIRFPNGKVHEDEYVTYKVFSEAKAIVYINKQLYYYRKSSNSITGSNFSAKRLVVLDAYEEKKVFYKEDSELYSKVVLLYQKILKKYFFNTKKFVADNKEHLSNIRKKLKQNYKDIKSLKFRT